MMPRNNIVETNERVDHPFCRRVCCLNVLSWHALSQHVFLRRVFINLSVYGGGTPNIIRVSCSGRSALVVTYQ